MNWESLALWFSDSAVIDSHFKFTLDLSLTVLLNNIFVLGLQLLVA